MSKLLIVLTIVVILVGCTGQGMPPPTQTPFIITATPDAAAAQPTTVPPTPDATQPPATTPVPATATVVETTVPPPTEEPIVPLPTDRSEVVKALGYDPNNGRFLSASVASPVTPVITNHDGSWWGIIEIVKYAEDFILGVTMVAVEQDDECQILFDIGSDKSYVALSREGYISFYDVVNDVFLPMQYGRTTNINFAEGASNTVIVDAQGNQANVYVNNLQPEALNVTNVQTTGGKIVVATFSPGGENTKPGCTFSDFWVWVPN